MYGKKLELLDSIEEKGISDADFAVLKKLSKSSSSEVRFRVAELLAQRKIRGGSKILIKLCRDKKYLVRASACDSISIYDDLCCFEQVLTNLHDKNDIVVNYAIGSAAVLVLEFFPEKINKVREKLNGISDNSNPALHCAKYALGDESMAECIMSDLESGDSYVKSNTLHNLNLLKSHCDLNVFKDKLDDLAENDGTVFVGEAAQQLCEFWWSGADIEKIFSFLVTDYGMEFRFQEFKNCFGGYWLVNTYSYFNESGCLTIHIVPQRSEYDFYFSEHFSEKREELLGEDWNFKLQSIGQEIWKKARDRIAFQYRTGLVLKTHAEVIKQHIEQNGGLFNIQFK